MIRTRAIIHAAGQQTRWAGAFGVSKHELPFDGETLLGRMVRLLLENGVWDIIISGPYPDYGVPTFKPTFETDVVDGRLSVRDLWAREGRTVILMGDVCYSDESMETIIGYDGPEPHLFARFGPSRYTGKGGAEIWANSFLADQRDDHETLLREVLAGVPQRWNGGQPSGRAGMWEAYLHAHGALVSRPYQWWVADLGDATVIDDWTEDFDYPEDYLTFAKRRAGE